MNNESSKKYEYTKSCLSELLNNQKEYLEIISEFKDNKTIHQIYELTLSEEAEKHLMLMSSIYVLTLRKMAKVINELRGKLQSSNKKIENHYERRCEELEKELQKTKADLEAISKIINRGESIE